MANETLEAVKNQLVKMKKIELTGFTNTETATAYFQEKEEILEGIVKTLETVTANQTTQIFALESTVKSLRDDLKTQVKYPKELTRREMLHNIGKGISAAWSGNHKSLAELSFSPNLKSENWTNPRDVTWSEKGFQVSKAALGEPMGNMATNDQYLINPIYETEIMTDAAKKSVMMNLVRHRPMIGPSMFLPTRDRGGVELHWLTAYGQKIQGSKPKGAERVELKAYTLAGYIPWFDEFEEDVFVDLGQMFIDEFIEVYGQEFDRQCLLADEDPFTGAMACEDVIEKTITANSISGLTWKDFRDAVYEIDPVERKDCCWFLNETVLNHIANIEDTTGRPIWRRPTEAMPGRLDLYPYHEVSILPQFADIKADKPFAVFMNPKRIQHGNRKGIESRSLTVRQRVLNMGNCF